MRSLRSGSVVFGAVQGAPDPIAFPHAAWAAWDARAAWDAWAARAAWDARAAGAAGAALSIYYSRLMAWMDGEPDQYTTGLRDAYANGLAIAIPVAKNTLGWAMGNTS